MKRGSSSKVAVVGLGYWGPNLVRNLVGSVGANRVVMVDASIDRLRAIGSLYPTAGCAQSLEQALAAHDVAGVIVATPVTTHYPIARMALDAGCHVLVEKPIAASSDEARELVLLADARGLVLMGGHTFLFSPRVECMKNYLADGELGDVQYVTSSRMNLGLYQKDVSVIWDLAPHDFSILFHLLGEFPDSIQTSGRASMRSGTLDVAFMNLTFPSGVVAAVAVSWLAPGKVRKTVIVGDKQMLIYDDMENELPIKVYDQGVVAEPGNFGEHQLTYRFGSVLAPYVAPKEPLAQEVAHFLDCMSGAAQCRSDGWFGLGVVEALEAAERSWLRGGMPVTVGGSRLTQLVLPA